MDLCVEYNKKRFPIELKIRYDRKTKQEGIKQISDYMDTLNLTEGWLVIFDRRKSKSWKEKITWKTKNIDGRTIHIVGC